MTHPVSCLKLPSCFVFCLQFQVKVHDFPGQNASTSRGGSTAMRFFNTHQLKVVALWICLFLYCLSIKQWKKEVHSNLSPFSFTSQWDISIHVLILTFFPSFASFSVIQLQWMVVVVPLSLVLAIERYMIKYLLNHPSFYDFLHNVIARGWKLNPR